MKIARRECELNKLCKLPLWYVAGSDGVKKIKKTLKANKGASYFPNVMTLEHVTYVVWTTQNHADQWKHKLWIETLKDGEKIKAKDYKTLPQDERSKYAPEKPRGTHWARAQKECTTSH